MMKLYNSNENNPNRTDYQIIRFDRGTFTAGEGAAYQFYGPYEVLETAQAALRQHVLTKAEEERFNRPNSNIRVEFFGLHSGGVLCDDEVIWSYELR